METMMSPQTTLFILIVGMMLGSLLMYNLMKPRK